MALPLRKSEQPQYLNCCQDQGFRNTTPDDLQLLQVNIDQATHRFLLHRRLLHNRPHLLLPKHYHFLPQFLLLIADLTKLTVITTLILFIILHRPRNDFAIHYLHFRVSFFRCKLESNYS